MLTSSTRIHTTHVGSLPRNELLANLLVDQEAGKTIDRAQLAAEVEKATRHVIAAQVKAGVDIGNDGEQQRGFRDAVSEVSGPELERRGVPDGDEIAPLPAPERGEASGEEEEGSGVQCVDGVPVFGGRL